MIWQEETKQPPAELGPLYEPDPVPFTFETVGWSVVAVLLVILLIYLGYRRFKKYRRNRYRRDAVAQLRALLGTTSRTEASPVADFCVLLKAVAIKSYGRETVGNLYGEEWVNFLKERSKHTPLTTTAIAVLSQDEYKKESEPPISDADYENMIQWGIKWTEKHVA